MWLTNNPNKFSYREQLKICTKCSAKFFLFILSFGVLYCTTHHCNNFLSVAGLYVLASESVKIPWFDAVFADIGDEQSLSQSLSTFSGHLKQINVRIIYFPEHFSPH